MNKAIPEGGRSVKCARCGHQWRMLPPEEPEELTEALDPAPDGAAAAELPHSAGDFGAGAAGYGHGPSPTSFAETAARYEQTASDGFSENAAQYDAEPYESAAAEPEPEQESQPWEIRRGNLAAALASMSKPVTPEGDDSYADLGQPYQTETNAWSGEAAAYQAAHNEGLHSPAADHTAFADESTAPAAPASFADHLDAAGAVPSWMREQRAQRTTGNIDAESSVRQVFHSALDDPDAAGQDEYDPQGDGSAVFRSDPDMEEPSMDARATWAAMDATGGDMSLDPDAPATDAPADASQQAFSDRWKTFAASEGLTEAEAVEAALSTERQQDTETFENDIAGIFRQQMQAKRNFGPASRAKTSGDDFTDYDIESDEATAMADDRYMADSPLDADAAALQAALEGSLRQRHTEESRSGAGGLALAAAWAVFLSVLSGVMLAFVNFREDVVVALPGMGELYHAVGLGVEEQQIDFGNVNYRWTVADGKPMIEVTGQIINMTDREIAVPRVLINVRDKENGDPVKATATLRSDPLSARETADFTLEFISPSKSISQIELAFAEKTQ